MHSFSGEGNGITVNRDPPSREECKGGKPRKRLQLYFRKDARIQEGMLKKKKGATPSRHEKSSYPAKDAGKKKCVSPQPPGKGLKTTIV